MSQIRYSFSALKRCKTNPGANKINDLGRLVRPVLISHGRGRWFNPSIAHHISVNAAQCLDFPRLLRA